ncbi:unnamed protein product, partial [Protopolystoma xenopodis]
VIEPTIPNSSTTGLFSTDTSQHIESESSDSSFASSQFAKTTIFATFSPSEDIFESSSPFLSSTELSFTDTSQSGAHASPQLDTTFLPSVQIEKIPGSLSSIHPTAELLSSSAPSEDVIIRFFDDDDLYSKSTHPSSDRPDITSNRKYITSTTDGQVDSPLTTTTSILSEHLNSVQSRIPTYDSTLVEPIYDSSGLITANTIDSKYLLSTVGSHTVSTNTETSFFTEFSESILITTTSQDSSFSSPTDVSAFLSESPDEDTHHDDEIRQTYQRTFIPSIHTSTQANDLTDLATTHSENAAIETSKELAPNNDMSLFDWLWIKSKAALKKRRKRPSNPTTVP